MSDTDHWYVYILRCADNSLYTGITKDLAQRIKVHNLDNINGAKYTRRRRPVQLVYSETLADRSAATRREIAIKQLSKDDKEALIIQRRSD